MESFIYLRKPHYYETDQMGIIHHSNYVRWLEEARVAWLEAVGIPYHELEKNGLMIPVLGITCDYIAMVQYAEEVAIEVSIEEYNGGRLNFSYRIYKIPSNETCTTGTSRHCFLDKTTKGLLHLKRSHPEIHRQFLALSRGEIE